MGIVEILLISISLAMDAFAVAICKGLSMKKMSWKKGIIIGLYFGVLQGIMPLIGYFLGSTFENLVTKYDHWIAFILLSAIGLNMIKEAFSKKEEDDRNDNVDFKTMIILAIATSIDALAIGITYAVIKMELPVALFAFVVIGIVTFIISTLGVKIGNKFGDKYENKAEFAGRNNFSFIRFKNFIRRFRHFSFKNIVNIKIILKITERF